MDVGNSDLTPSLVGKVRFVRDSPGTMCWTRKTLPQADSLHVTNPPLGQNPLNSTANRAFICTKGPKWSGPPYDQVQLLATGSPLPAHGSPGTG
jgi:hypothetical protein